MVVMSEILKDLREQRMGAIQNDQVKLLSPPLKPIVTFMLGYCSLETIHLSAFLFIFSCLKNSFHLTTSLFSASVLSLTKEN